MLDVRNKCRSTPRVAIGIGRFAPFQRTDPIDRPALLPLNRNKIGHFRRPRIASPLLGARRHRHERTLLEWFLLVTADACANRSFETDSLFPRSARLSPRLRHRIRLLSADTTAPHPRIEKGRRPFLRRSGQWYHGLRGSGRPRYGGRYQCRSALRGKFVLHLAPRRSLYRGAHR